MKREIMTLEQFHAFREKYFQLLEEIISMQTNNIEDVTDEMVINWVEEINRFSEYLTSFDLSGIPAEEWKDFSFLVGEHIHYNFENTHANFDFSIIPFFEADSFKGCNIENLDSVENTRGIRPELFDKEVIEQYDFIFLPKDIFSEEFTKKYYDNVLEIDDLVSLNEEQIDVLESFNFIDHFYIDENNMLPINDEDEIDPFMFLASVLTDQFGHQEFFQLLEQYVDIFKSIYQSGNMNYFANFFNIEKEGLDIQTLFQRCVKRYIHMFDVYNQNGDIPLRDAYTFPEWMHSMPLKIIPSIQSIEDLEKYDPDTMIVANEGQSLTLDNLGVSNLLEFAKEMGYPSNPTTSLNFMEMFEGFNYYFYTHVDDELIENNIYFQNGTLSYEDFKEELAKFLDFLRRDLDNTYSSYQWMEGSSFHKQFPNIFLDEDASEQLKPYFYRNLINFHFLELHPQFTSYFLNHDMSVLFPRISMEMPYEDIGILVDNFVWDYCTLFGNEAFLEFVEKYHSVLSTNMVIHASVDDIPANKDDLLEGKKRMEKAFRDSVITEMMQHHDDYSHLERIPEFQKEHPDLFLNLDSLSLLSRKQKAEVLTQFNQHALSFGTIRKYPEIIPYLKDLNLWEAFHKYDGYHDKNGSIIRTGRVTKDVADLSPHVSDLVLLQELGNNRFLTLCTLLGDCLEGLGDIVGNYFFFQDGHIYSINDRQHEYSFEEFIAHVKKIVAKEYKKGTIHLSEDAPPFLKEEYPELFLAEDAPKELKECFYNYQFQNPLNFTILHRHPEWMPYLEGKDLYTAFLQDPYTREGFREYFQLFGEKAIPLGIHRSDTVDRMVLDGNVSLMYQWYQKTGNRFIPDYAIMSCFPIEEADKFLTSGSVWSQLSKNAGFSENVKKRTALAKLAYTFGAFDHDSRGFKKLQEVLTSLPKTISKDNSHIMDTISKSLLKRNNPFMQNEDMGRRKYIPDALITNFVKALKEEGLTKESYSSHLDFIYKKEENGSYTLTINSQRYPKTTQAFREILGCFQSPPILTPNACETICSKFGFRYDPEFREFFLENLSTILSNNTSYYHSIAEIQRRFEEMKAVYANIPLTFDLALSYISNHRYENVNTGNTMVETVASIPNYSQESFDTLQKIYNYAKARTFSSIPRVFGKTEEYTYEMLRLEDPLALIVGNLTDCCQVLGDNAEMCVEHGMVDKNGRIFVVRDKKHPEKIIAQSWVWRNGNTICFDNIEVPDQQMWDHGIPKKMEDSGIRNEFTDEILKIYQQAAKELMEEDNRVYQKLLQEGKITQKEFDQLRLRKVTVGEGWSNIKGSFVILEREHDLSNPPAFTPPVSLESDLYISDSSTQYILEEDKTRDSYEGKLITPHHDDFVVHTDETFTKDMVYLLERLEIETNGESSNLSSSLRDNSTKDYVSQIAEHYGLVPIETRIILHPNFALLYEDSEDKISIREFFYNLKVDNGEQQMDIRQSVLTQLHFALEQITEGKELDLFALDSDQINLIEDALHLGDELDQERGLTHGK